MNVNFDKLNPTAKRGYILFQNGLVQEFVEEYKERQRQKKLLAKDVEEFFVWVSDWYEAKQ